MIYTPYSNATESLLIYYFINEILFIHSYFVCFLFHANTHSFKNSHIVSHNHCISEVVIFFRNFKDLNNSLSSRKTNYPSGLILQCKSRRLGISQSVICDIFLVGFYINDKVSSTFQRLLRKLLHKCYASFPIVYNYVLLLKLR